MYLDDIALQIRQNIPSGKLPSGNADELFLIYAVLLRGKGLDVTCADVHDAWSAWMAKRVPGHASLVAYDSLPKAVQDEDEVYAAAIRSTAIQLGNQVGPRRAFLDVLFPAGPPKSDAAIQQTLDLYKVMVTSSEGLVARRQNVNTFFLTMNGALLTACGIIVQNATRQRPGGLGVAVLSAAGAILCFAWRSLISSFGQLNSGKFKVINTIELSLSAAIYAAEWEALGRGRDPKIYRSFTSREVWVPWALLALYSIAIVVGLLVAFGFVTVN